MGGKYFSLYHGVTHCLELGDLRQQPFYLVMFLQVRNSDRAQRLIG